MNNYIRALAIANSSETGSWGQITGTFTASASTIVWATKTGGTTVLADANFLNLTNGLSGNQIRLGVYDCEYCLFQTVYYCVRGGTPQIATGGWESKTRTDEIAVGLLVDVGEANDSGFISIDERSNNGDVAYSIKFALDTP